LEDRIPVDKRGRPDLSHYSEPLEHYVELYNLFLNTDWKNATRRQQTLAWKQRVHGTWGLLAKGPEALPFLLKLVRHPNPDAREDASHLLGELRSRTDHQEQLLALLQEEEDLVVKSSLIEALGKLRYRPAIPALAAIILNQEIDVDTRWNAADSLGLIVGELFAAPDKLQRAAAWINEHQRKWE